ncbi:MAG: FIST C-terminal domain-containing protein [Planctomycetes bacterium]|nr:FIST C-terminal domain-containing protein [Planctomycetota bacterium]
MTTTCNLTVRRGVSTSTDPVTAARELFEALRQPDIEFAVFYCAPEYDLDVLGAELKKHFAGVRLIGCTTAGEITPIGYVRGTLTGVSIAGPSFKVTTELFEGLSETPATAVSERTSNAVARLAERGEQPVRQNTFAFLLIDGLCMREELFVSSVYRGLGNLTVFGGSAGDGTRFQATHVFCDGEFRRDSAVLALVQTDRPFTVFRTQHFVPSEDKLVVTEADPANRIVTEINGVPAGREYARVLGVEVEELTPLVFATHPVMVRVGGQYYVRSIQKVNPDGSLTFFCAIDAGIVLTAARGVDFVEDLEATFHRVREQVGEPELVLGCDCILRHLELDREGLKDRVGQILAKNNVIGFSTYGEQFEAMHVNQTFTGVAIGSSRPAS